MIGRTNFKLFILTILLFLIYCTACNETKYDCTHFDEIYMSDQELRGDKRVNVALKIADSLRIERGYAIGISSAELQQEAYSILKESGFKRQLFIDTIVADSLEGIMIENDIKNVKLLLDVINTHDIHYLDSLECFRKALIVFAHTPDNYIEEVIEAVEYLQDILSEGSYAYFRNRLDSFKELRDSK